MALPFRNSPAYAFGIAAFLAAAQAWAFLEQWRLGFRPFASAPQRVTLSWDMFAVEIERCGVSWDPPTYWAGKSVRGLEDLSAPIEWDTVFNLRTDYLQAAGVACAYRGPQDEVKNGRFKVRCFVSGGKETSDEFACPQYR